MISKLFKIDQTKIENGIASHIKYQKLYVFFYQYIAVYKFCNNKSFDKSKEESFYCLMFYLI